MLLSDQILSAYRESVRIAMMVVLHTSTPTPHDLQTADPLTSEIQNSDRSSASASSQIGTRAVTLFYFSK
jgi:hypothetical protein